MQDGQLSNTLFEDQLNQSDWGKFLPGTSTLNPQGPPPKTSTQTNYDQLEQSLLAQGAEVNKQASSIASPYKEAQINPLSLDLTGRYTHQLPGADNEDLWGQSQSNWDKMFNGITKGLALAGTTFLQGTLGLAYGVGQVLTGNGFNSLYNNDFSNALQDINNSIENKLPNYYTARERAADWWEPSNIFTANFVWDKLVKNLGFSVGALYSGAVVSKMLGLIPKAFNLSKAGILSAATTEMESTLTALPSLQRGAAAENIILNTSKTANALNTVMAPAERFLISTLGAATEGGIEALQGINDWRAQKIEEYKATNGVIPQGADLDKINSTAEDLGNARFGMNMALLTATNYFQLPKILSSSYKESKIIANGIERSINPITRKLETGLYESALPSKGIAKLYHRTKSLAGLLFSPTESFEEISQYAAQKSVEDYYNKAYRGEGRDWLNSIGEGYTRALSDKEGLESGLLGGLSGGLQQAGFISVKGIGKTGEIGERGVLGTGGERAKATTDFLTALNKSKGTQSPDGWMQAMAMSAARGINLQLDGQNYIRQGDLLEAKDNEFDYQHNYLTPRIQYSRFDLVKDDINSYRTLAASPDGWNKLKEMGIANEGDTTATFLSRLAQFEAHANNVNSLHQSLNVRYGGILNKDKTPKYSQEAIEKMVYAASKVANYDTRIPQVNASLALQGIATQPIIDNIVVNNRVPELATKDALNQINNLDTLSDTKDQLKSDLRDLIELTLRRKKFLREYDQLKEDPEKYSPIEEPEYNTSTKIKGKDVEIGKAYSLAQPLFREGNKLSISPTLTVLSSTLKGELEVRIPTGEITYRKPSQLSYDLLDTDVTDEKYNEIAEKAIDGVIGQEDGRDTLVQKLSFINSQNDSELTDEVEASILKATKEFTEQQDKINKANEKLAKDKALQKKLKAEQDRLNATSGIETLDEPSPEDIARLQFDPNAPLPSFRSKDAGYFDAQAPASEYKAQQARLQSFLSTYPSLSSKQSAKIRVLAITANNEASYGLTGLIAYTKEQLKSSPLTEEQRAIYLDAKGEIKPQHEPIIKLYAIKDKKSLKLLSPEGKALSTLKGNVLEELKSQGLFSTFVSVIDGEFKFGSRAGQQNYSGKFKEEDVAKINEEHQAWRQSILDAPLSPEYEIAHTSRGVIITDDENKPLTATSLATDEDLKNKEHLIVIPTIEGQISNGGLSYNYPPGFPVFQNGPNITFLNNRLFTQKEAENVFQLIRRRVEIAGSPESERIEKYLSSILYLRSPKVGESITSEAQIFHTTNGLKRTYYFGSSIQVDFNTIALDQSRDLIISYLSNYFVKTNNKILLENTSLGYETPSLNQDGVIKEWIQHPSYQYFLLSSASNPNPFLQTRARRSVSPEDPSIVSRYTVLKGDEFAYESSHQEPEARTEEGEAEIPASREQKIISSKKGRVLRRSKKNEEISTEEEVVAIIPTIQYFAKSKMWQGEYVNTRRELTIVLGDTKESVEKQLKALGVEIPVEKAKEETAEDKLSKTKKNQSGTEPLDLSVVNETTKYSPIDVEKELAYIAEKSPFSTEILKNVIKTSQGIFAWGQFKGMLISLYDKAQSGTGYHELFEGVWKVFTTPTQKAAIIQEFKERDGSFQYFDGKEYHTIDHKYATEFQAKEKLADEFAEYVLTKQKPQGPKLLRWFKQLLDFISSIFTGKTHLVDNLFASIDAGNYKSASTLYVDDVSEYSFAELPYTDQYETVQGIAITLIQQLINPANEDSISLTEFDETKRLSIKDHYDATFKRLQGQYEHDLFTDDFGIVQRDSNDKVTNLPQIQAYMAYWENVKQDWDVIKEQVNEYLYSLGITQGIENEAGEIERIDREDYSNREYIDDRKYFMSDPKQTAARSIKLLFATIPESEFKRDGSIKSSRSMTTLMQRPVNYGKEFNFILSQLLPHNTYPQKLEALEALAKKFPNAQRLLLRLTATHEDSILQDWNLKTRFYQAMSKQEPTPWIQYNQPNGSSITATANLESSKKQIVQGWIDTMKALASTGDSKIFNINDKGELVLHTDSFKFAITTTQEKTKFLSQIGIEFTQEMFNSLSADSIRLYNLAVAGLAHSLKAKKTFILENSKAFDAIRNLESIASASIQAGTDVDTIFRNIDGEWQTTRIATNASSRWANTLNTSEDREELFQQMPWLSNITDSIYLNSILYGKDGKKTQFSIDMGYIQGTQDSNGRPIPGAKLSIFSRLSQEINQNLRERYYALLPADSKTQWLFSLRNFITYNDVATDARDYKSWTTARFLEYYNTEKASYTQLSETLDEKDLLSRRGAFKELSENYTMSDEKFSEAVWGFINNQVVLQRKMLGDYSVIAKNKNKETYSWKSLDGEFMQANGIKNVKSLEDSTIDNILLSRTINYAINNIEMHKLFFGDTLAYKDAKRWKLFQSPREVSMYDVPEFNTYLNEEKNSADNIQLPNALTGLWKFSDYIPTVMMDDVTVNNEALYKTAKINATDAQAWSTITALRERRLKGGTWLERDETQYQYSQALDRQLMLSDGILQSTNKDSDNYYPPSLQSQDEALVAEGNPNSSYVYVEKPILSGHVQIDGSWSPITDKFSIISLSYAAIRETNFRHHYVKMLRQGVGYIIAQSGRKVGKTTPNTFYTPDGSVNTTPYEGITPIPFSAFGVQTDTSNKKESQTRGSQITKLILINLYDNGKPISEKINSLAQHNLSLLKEQTDIGYNKLLKAIGAEDKDGRYTITDKRKIVALLKDELLKREIADSIKALIGTKIGKPEELVMPFEALPNYIQIKNILYSFVDKYILRPKVSGAPKVQVSGALMEKYGLKKHSINGKDVYTSSSLHFYTEKEPWIDVLLPSWVAQKLRKAGLKWNSAEELYKLFTSSPDAQQLLSGIGFRIPTQELNSVENMRMAGFLPEEMGDTIVVPEEITLKAGSDFDIDKLNSYLQNIYVDNKKQIRIIPFFGVGEEGKSKLKDWVEEDVNIDWLLNEKKINPSKYESYEDYLLADPIESLTEEDFREDEEKAVDAFERMYSQSIENEYYRNMSEILALPENFQRLVTPNTTAAYTAPKTGIRDQLVELSEVFDSSLNPTIISPIYMLKTRHDALTAKDLVGIAAVAQTGIASRQLSSILIDPSRIKTLRSNEKLYLPNNAQPLLPHNSINGKATLSSIKDVEGNYISDNNSQILNGAVDAFNDAFLSQINYNRRTSPIYHIMTAWGTPNTPTHPIITMFLNQPIIRNYLGALDVAGKGFIIDRGLIASTIKKFRGLQGPYASPAKEFSTSLTSLTESLKANIKDYYGSGGVLSLEQRGQQLLVFREFLKYAVLSNNLFRFQQGSSWDTARFNDPNSAYFKNYQLNQAKYMNIFSDISTYMANTHLGTQRTAIKDINQTLSDVLPVQSELVRQTLSPILTQIAASYLSLDSKNNVARKLEESLFNFLIQTKTGINNSLSQMLVDAKTALTTQLKEFKKQPNSPEKIQGNFILNRLIPSIGGRKAISTKNITLAIKPRDVFSKNFNNKAFQELYNNPLTQSLARSLIKISFLQNGVSNSRISFKDAIPAQLYADVVNEIVPSLQDEDALNSFISSDSFYRNNWSDEDIIPSIFSSNDPNDIGINELFSGYKPLNNFISTLKAQGEIPIEARTPVVAWIAGREAFSPFITHIDTEYMPNEEPPIIRKRLLQNTNIVRDIEDPENPGQTIKKTLFIHTPAWGDSYRAQEHYATPHSSVFDNGYLKPQIEINVPSLVEYISSGEWKTEIQQPEEGPRATAVTEATPSTQSGITKIISGGQTGVDVAGLDAAIELGIPTGGTAAAKFQQSIIGDKKIFTPELATKYGLKEGKITQREGKYGKYGDVYYQRTIDNAQEANGTIWFGNASSPGGKLTLGTIAQKGKPKPLVNPKTIEEIQKWISDNNIHILNVAGNREHTNPGIYEKAKNMLLEALNKPAIPNIPKPGEQLGLFPEEGTTNKCD